MALSIVKDSTQYQGSKSPIGFKVATNSHRVSLGLKSQTNLEVVANPLASDYLEFSLFGATNYIRIDFDTALNDEGTNVRTNIFGLSLNDYTIQLADDLRRNFYLSSNYTITPNSNVIELVSKEVGYGTALNPSPGSIIFPRVFMLPVTAGSDDVYHENYSIVCELLVELQKESNNFESIATLEAQPFDNLAKFDFSEVLDACLSLTLPNMLTAAPTKCVNSLKRYFIRYYEKYGNPAVEKMVYETPSKAYVLKGGIKYQNWKGNQMAIIDARMVNNAFISNYGVKTTRKTQPQFVAWLCNIDSSTLSYQLTLSFELRYQSGNGSYHQQPYVLIFFKPYDVFRFQTGYNQLNIDAVKTPGEIVTSYSVIITSADGLFGYTDMEYVVDDTPVLDEHYYIYANSVGDYDTMACTGEQSIIPEVERLSADIYKDFENKPTAFNVVSAYNEERVKKKQASGYKDKQELEMANELFLSREVYEVVDGNLVPIELKSNSFEKFKSRQNLNAFEFEFSYAFKDSV